MIPLVCISNLTGRYGDGTFKENISFRNNVKMAFTSDA